MKTDTSRYQGRLCPLTSSGEDFLQKKILHIQGRACFKNMYGGYPKTLRAHFSGRIFQIVNARKNRFELVATVPFDRISYF